MNIIPASNTSIPAFAWNSFPDPARYVDRFIRIADYGVGHGSYWHSDGSTWQLIGFTQVFNNTSYPSGTYASETVVGQVIIPMGIFKPNDVLETVIRSYKNGTLDGFTHKVRFGTAGTIADTQIHSLANGNTNQSFAQKLRFRLINNTTIRLTSLATTNSTGSTTVTDGATDITISDVSSNNMVISSTIQKNSGVAGETLAIRELIVNHFPGPG